MAIAKRFIFIPSVQLLSAINEGDSAHQQLAPPILISLITSQPETSTARKISEVIKNSDDWCAYEFLCDPNPFKNQEIFQHQKVRSLLPLVSLMAGSAGWGMENGIRLTLLCRENFNEMVEFYSLVLNSAHTTKTRDHIIFSLMDSPTSTLELVLQNCSCLGVSPCLPGSIKLHFIVDGITSLAMKLCRAFPDCHMTEASGSDQWKVTDPLGNKIFLHDKEQIKAC